MITPLSHAFPLGDGLQLRLHVYQRGPELLIHVPDALSSEPLRTEGTERGVVVRIREQDAQARDRADGGDHD